MSHFVLITGGREPDLEVRDDIEAVLKLLKGLHGHELRVMHGAARGVDSWAEELCQGMGIKSKGYPADWDGRGKRAGFERNEKMVALLCSWTATDHTAQVVAFPGGRGTANCVQVARDAGLDVSEMTPGATPEPAR